MSRYFNEYEDYDENSLEHHGILGMKWGVRRYQNADGSLTDKGKKRYYSDSSDIRKRAKGVQRHLNDIDEERIRNKRKLKASDRHLAKTQRYFDKAQKRYDETSKKNGLDKWGQNTLDEVERYGTAKMVYESTKSENRQLRSESRKLEKQVNSIVKKAGAEGMSITSSPCVRWEGRGRASVAAILTMATPLTIIPVGPDMVPRGGTKYSVKNVGGKQKNFTMDYTKDMTPDQTRAVYKKRKMAYA